MNIPLGPSFDTIRANLLKPRQTLASPPQEDPGPLEQDNSLGIIEQPNRIGTFEVASILGAIVLVVIAALMFIL